MSNAANIFEHSSSLSVLHNYFDDLTKLYFQICI